jgi:hypothetical protein
MLNAGVSFSYLILVFTYDGVITASNTGLPGIFFTVVDRKGS